VGLLFALSYVAVNSVGYVFFKHALSNTKSSLIFFFEMLFGLLLWIPFAFGLGVSFDNWITVAWYALISAVLSEAFIFYIFTKGQLSITITIYSTYSIFTLLYSHWINGDRLEAVEYFFVALTILGTLLVTLPKKLNWKAISASASQLIWPLLGANAIGISDSLSKNIIERESLGVFLFFLALMQLPVSIMYLHLDRQSFIRVKEVFTKLVSQKQIFLGPLCISASMIFFWLAFDNLSASIASPLTATSPLVVIPLSVIFLKEKLTFLQVCSLILMVIGIIGVSMQ
jgi:drug/metabolite transporter (DMT)-like permease